MAKLWGGRFTKETDPDVFRFNASISFDKRLWACDIEGSRVHAAMLVRQGILSAEDGAAIEQGLSEIASELADGRLSVDETAEDIHSFVEAELTARIGDAGKRLHTGRSRNDQVALDMRMYVREDLTRTADALRTLLSVILDGMEEHIDSVMPGFTHLQKAQPTTLAHHLGAYFAMFRRDLIRLRDTKRHLNECPLGSGAFAGTTYPLDREYTARELGFDRPCANSMDGVSDRDYLIEYLSDLALIQMHLSRFCEEIILWNSDEYRFVEIDDAYSTGSSIMPQKKNPDIAELVRGKTGRVYGALNALLVTMKGLPLAYNKDMQEDKETAFDAMDTVRSCIRLFTGMLSTMRFRKDVMARSARRGFTNATDAADYLVRKGVPFRDAHGIIGRIVVDCVVRQIAIDELTLAELQTYSPAFEEDIYEALSMEACVSRRLTAGAPGRAAMEAQIADAKAFLES